MPTKQTLKFITGFLLLFSLYHLAEYFVLFTYRPIYFLALQACFFVFAWLVARWQGFTGLGAWGLSFQRGWLQQLLAGMIMGILLYGGSFGISLLLHSETITGVPSPAEMLQPMLLFCFGNFFSSFSEDILTRGYLYRHLKNQVTTRLFLFISPLVYVLNHIYRLGEGWPSYVYLFCLGILLVIPLVFTNRLWLTGGIHWMGNSVFYFTHGILETSSTGSPVMPNTLFIFWMLLLLPLEVLLLRWAKFNRSLQTFVN